MQRSVQVRVPLAEVGGRVTALLFTALTLAAMVALVWHFVPWRIAAAVLLTCAVKVGAGLAKGKTQSVLKFIGTALFISVLLACKNLLRDDQLADWGETSRFLVSWVGGFLLGLGAFVFVPGLLVLIPAGLAAIPSMLRGERP